MNAAISAKENEVNSSVLTVSTIMEVLGELKISNLMIMDLIVKLSEVTDFDKTLRWLSSVGKLSLAHYVVNYHHDNGNIEYRNNMLIALMRETIDSSQFEHFFVLKKKYDYTIKEQSRYFVDSFIENILEDEYYLEIKLNIIMYFLSEFERESAQNLLDALDELLKRIKTKRSNIWTANI